jgi:hypothetical protein
MCQDALRPGAGAGDWREEDSDTGEKVRGVSGGARQSRFFLVGFQTKFCIRIFEI